MKLSDDLDQAVEKNNKLQSDYNDYRIELAIRQAASTAGALPEAIDDIIARSKGVFSIDVDQSVVARNSEGNLRITEDNQQLTPDTFIKDLKKSAKHFWPHSTTGGMSGSIGQVDLTEADVKLAAAAKSGDMKSYRAIRAAQKSTESGVLK